MGLVFRMVNGLFINDEKAHTMLIDDANSGFDHVNWMNLFPGPLFARAQK